MGSPRLLDPADRGGYHPARMPRVRRVWMLAGAFGYLIASAPLCAPGSALAQPPGSTEGEDPPVEDETDGGEIDEAGDTGTDDTAGAGGGEGSDDEGEELDRNPYQDEDESDRDLYVPADEPTTPRTVCAGRRIRRLIVQGARRVAEDDVLATMELEEDVPCSDSEVARDARALWDLGFFDDIVFAALPVGRDAIDLYVQVEERPAIGEIRFVGNDEVSDSDIDEKVTLREGEVLSVPDVQRQVTRIRDLYAEEGYFLAQVEYELREADEGEVEVRFLIEEGEEVSVRRIRFVGNASIDAGELTGFMRTSQTGFFSFIASDDTFNREHFEEDVQRLQAIYYDRGYLAVQVGTPRIELTADRRHIEVTIPIEEGPRFRIGRLRVAEIDDDGAEIEPLGGRRQIREMIDASPGDWFSRSSIAESLQAITRFYRDEGYARAELAPQTDLDVDEQRVNVVVTIQRGPPVRIERINIRGNTKTRDQVIRREIQIVEGELYNQTLVERSKAFITALGYFERVDVSEEEGSAPDRIVLNFEIAERPTGTFQVGAGFSSIETFIFTAQIQQQNFLGRGQSVSGQLQLSGIRQLVQLRFVEPWLFGTQWSLAVEGFKTIRQFADFTQDSTGGGLTIGHPLFDNRFNLFLRYRGEFVDISGRGTGVFGNVGTDVRGARIFTVLPIAGLFQDGFTSSLTLTATWDSRNNRVFTPTEGIFASYSFEVAEGFLGSENIFLRHRAFFRLYQEIFGPFVFKGNLEAGLITSRVADEEQPGVPVFERFFLGGIFNVRGFDLNSLGPRVGLPRAIDPTGGVSPFGIPIGGNFEWHYNLEIEFALIEEVGIRGVIFTDGGNAWNLEDRLCQSPLPSQGDDTIDPCGFNPLNIRTSWGFGFRWISPLGPLRFEWGLPFSPRGNEDNIRFEFTIGQFF